MALYGADLAFVHDAGFSAFGRRAAPGLLKLLRERGVRRGLVVDLGCGAGRWARTLADAGYDVLGVDVSPTMLRLARANCPRGRFKLASLHSVRLPKCDAITAIGEVLAYGRGDIRRFFRKAARALRPDGVLVFDLRLPDQELARGPLKQRFEGRGWALLLEKEQRGRRLLRRMTVLRGGRRARETHSLRLHRAAEVLAALRAAGFRAGALRSYGGADLPPTVRAFCAVTARRRPSCSGSSPRRA